MPWTAQCNSPSEANPWRRLCLIFFFLAICYGWNIGIWQMVFRLVSNWMPFISILDSRAHTMGREEYICNVLMWNVTVIYPSLHLLEVCWHTGELIKPRDISAHIEHLTFYPSLTEINTSFSPWETHNMQNRHLRIPSCSIISTCLCLVTVTVWDLDCSPSASLLLCYMFVSCNLIGSYRIYNLYYVISLAGVQDESYIHNSFTAVIWHSLFFALLDMVL